MYKRYFILVVVALLFGCTSRPEEPLRIGSNSWPGYEPLYIARDKGFYDGTKIQLVALPSASDVLAALRSGNLEGAALTLDESLTLLEDNIDLKVVLIMDFSDGGDVLLAKPGIDSISDLKGKTVALETTAVGAILLDGALTSANVSIDDITIQNCMVDKHLQCYEHVDAIVTFEPALTRLRELGAKLLFDSSQIPGRIVDVLVVSEMALKKQEGLVKKLIAGYFQARQLLDESPLETAESISPRLGLAPQQILDSFEGLKLPSLSENYQYLDEHNGAMKAIVKELSTLMVDKALLSREIKKTDIVTSQFLPAVNH